MALIDDLADQLAEDTLKLEAGEDDDLVERVSNVVGASSQTLQEAFLTAIRVRRAARRARTLLEEVARDRSA